MKRMCILFIVLGPLTYYRHVSIPLKKTRVGTLTTGQLNGVRQDDGCFCCGCWRHYHSYSSIKSFIDSHNVDLRLPQTNAVYIKQPRRDFDVNSTTVPYIRLCRTIGRAVLSGEPYIRLFGTRVLPYISVRIWKSTIGIKWCKTEYPSFVLRRGPVLIHMGQCLYDLFYSGL